MSTRITSIVLGCIAILGSQTLINASPVSTTAQERNGVVHSDYIYTPGIGYHKLHTQIVDWPSARRICRTEGAHLAIINSLAEAELLSQLLTQAGIPEISALSPLSTVVYVRQAAVGLHDLFQEGEWVTIHDESLAETRFAEWDYMEPSNLGRNENCGALRSTEKLNDVPCSHQQAFICELPTTWNSDLYAV